MNLECEWSIGLLIVAKCCYEPGMWVVYWDSGELLSTGNSQWVHISAAVFKLDFFSSKQPDSQLVNLGCYEWWRRREVLPGWGTRWESQSRGCRSVPGWWSSAFPFPPHLHEQCHQWPSSLLKETYINRLKLHWCIYVQWKPGEIDILKCIRYCFIFSIVSSCISYKSMIYSFTGSEGGL